LAIVDGQPASLTTFRMPPFPKLGVARIACLHSVLGGLIHEYEAA
jgi:hypothetical protein